MMETSKSYQHSDEPTELERLISQFQNDWAWERTLLAELGIKPTSERRRILSYGSGSGIDIATLLRDGYGYYGEGWEAKEKSVAVATTQFGSERLRFRTLDLLAGEMPSDIQSFDIVYLRLILLHVPFAKVNYLLNECKSLLREGGYLIVHDADKDKGNVNPSNHEFKKILDLIREFLIRSGNSPRIGSQVPDLMRSLQFKNISWKARELEADFDATIADLSYAPSIADNSQPDNRLIPKELWEAACNNRPINFVRTSTRVITVGQK